MAVESLADVIVLIKNTVVLPHHKHNIMSTVHSKTVLFTLVIDIYKISGIHVLKLEFPILIRPNGILRSVQKDLHAFYRLTFGVA